MKRKIILMVLILAVLTGALLYSFIPAPRKIVLTGIVTTDEVTVSSQIQGQLEGLFVKEGDTVTNGELLAQIQPQEWQADLDFYKSNERQAAAQLIQAQADLENASLNFKRIEGLYSNKV